MNPLLDAALDYASRGWPVIPLPDRDKAPPRLADWPDRATAEVSTIRRWWTRWPSANVGIATGAGSKFFVLDVDPEKGGEDTLLRLSHERGALPDTVMVRTGTGGTHFYFQHVPGLGNSVRRIGPGLDIRTDGGYVVAPPSIHPNGRAYQFSPGHRIIMAAPLWLIRAATKNDPTTVGSARVCTELTPYGEAALRSAATKIMAAPNGEQEATLNGQCYAIGRLAGAGGVPVELAIDILLTAASAMPSHDPRRPWRSSDVEKKVRRAFAQGLAVPRADEDDREAWRRIAEIDADAFYREVFE